MSVETYLLYLAAVAVFFATPPDTSQLLILSNAIRHGLRRSLWTAAGDLTANAIQMSVAAFGLAAIIATSATAFAMIKWLGVAYLAWIGLQLVLSKGGAERGPATANGAARLFRQGFSRRWQTHMQWYSLARCSRNSSPPPRPFFRNWPSSA